VRKLRIWITFGKGPLAAPTGIDQQEFNSIAATTITHRGSLKR